MGTSPAACAVTGTTEGLSHVSPRTGRAVCLEAAAPYLERLLVLPAFLIDGGPASSADLEAAFALTGHFLDMHVWSARQIEPPSTRAALIVILAEG